MANTFRLDQFLFLISVGLFCQSTLSYANDPPIAARQDTIMEIHGDRRVDPYAWLKDTRPEKSPEIIAYIEKENQYAQAIMADTEALQEKIYTETVGRIQEDDQGVPYKKGSYYYYEVTEKGKQYPIYFRKKGSLEGAPELLLDLNLLAIGKTFLKLGVNSVSPNEKILAYGLDFDGSRKFTLYFKDLSTGQILTDTIPAISNSFAWGNDNKTVFYASYDAALRTNRIYSHVLGSPTQEDRVVFHEPDEKFNLDVQKTRSSKYILIVSESKSTTEFWFIDADHPEQKPQLIEPRRQGHRYYVDHRLGGDFYIRTNDTSLMFQVVQAPVEAPSEKNWKTVVTDQPLVSIEDIDVFQNFLALTLREGGLTRLNITNFSQGDAKDVRFPDKAYIVSLGRNADYYTDFLRLTYDSLGTPTSTFDYDIQTQKLILKHQKPVPNYQSDLYETDRIFATAADGTRIPISLIYKKSLKKDGSNPTLLYGYGSYGVSMDPWFSPSRVSLLDRGFVYAVAHIRGGGELGDPWYQDGKLLKKKNTFNDFISCAEFLIQQGYTQPEKLAIEGGSAGGLLMGTVMNLRPELFKTVLAAVPFVDVVNSMLDASLPLTTEEYEEWGNPNNPEYYFYMKSYAPYENIEAKAYPHLLLTTGINDSQVSYWEPAKFAAKLRAMKTDQNMLLLKTEMGVGHGGASGRYDSIRKRAFELAFLFKTFGISE